MKWEYKKVGALNETAMNKLGNDGWELVSVVGDSRGLTQNMFFKKPIKEE